MSSRLRGRRIPLAIRPILENLERRCLLSDAASLNDAAVLDVPAGARQMEYLNRGVVAVRTSSSSSGTIYVGWRMLGTDPSSIGFNLYCSTNGAAAVKLNGAPLTASTNYQHIAQTYSQSHAYFVRPVVGGVEQPASETFTLAANVSANQYLNVPLQIPAGGTVSLPPGTQAPPSGTLNYTYNANDASVGDLDGDGQYEIILKWDPSNSQDNANEGLTGPVILDAYRLDGTLLWRINLGRNIRAGAHYTQFLVYDFDGDGRSEVVMKTADATVDGTGQVIGDATADYRDGYSGESDGRWGRILTGPEYLTVFDGLTGAALTTVPFSPARGSLSSWGDTYGNRMDRFLATVAYLDGTRPSIVMARGYYAKTTLTAYDWRDGQLTQRWAFDSTTPGNSIYGGQGNHNLSVADVDGDGRDEIVYGAALFDDDGTGVYATGYGHGDALHVTDMDPNRPGQEVWQIHESAGVPGSDLRDAATGAAIFTTAVNPTSDDSPGRGVAADVYAGNVGYEMWGGGGLFNSSGATIGRTPSTANFLVWWDADPLRELLDGQSSGNGEPRIDKYGTSSDTRLLTMTGTSTNNGTKATPTLSGDILGDWREEVVVRTSDNSALRIYTTTIPSTFRVYTLMHDPQYRVAISWQNTAYNQPPHPGFFLGAIDTSGTPSTPPTPNIYIGEPSPAPEAPTGLNAALTGSRQIDLAWNASPDADTYTVRRSTAAGGPYSIIAADIVGTNYSDTNVAAGLTYYYVVQAVNESSTPSANSNEDSVAVPGTTTTLQAEDASFGGGAVFESTNTGFNGTGYVNFPTTGGFLEFTNIDGGSGGQTLVQFRYALGITGNRSGLLFVNGVSQPITFGPSGGWTTWTLHEVVVNLNPGTTNTIRLESNGQDLANIDELRVTVIPGDTAAPTILSTQYDFEHGKLIVQFSEDVEDSLEAADAQVEPRAGGADILPSSFIYDGGTNTATFSFASRLPDGNYQLRIAAGAVEDAAQNSLAADYVWQDASFFVLAGDTNRDRQVTISDLGDLASNWQAIGATWSQGDFNFDGQVTISDLGDLASNWQATLPEAPSGLALVPVDAVAVPPTRVAAPTAPAAPTKPAARPTLPTAPAVVRPKRAAPTPAVSMKKQSQPTTVSAAPKLVDRSAMDRDRPIDAIGEPSMLL